jgi:DNA polymerase-3 subunit chi
VTQVDFYVSDSDSADARLRLACKIADQATERDKHVFIHSTSDDEARQLDELLWTFSQGSFIPHRVVRGELDRPPLEPVLIGVNQTPAPGRWDVLINLAAEVPEFFSRYERVAEVVDANAARREQSRERCDSMPEPLSLELNIPVLTDVIRSAANLPNNELDALLAEVQTKLASRTYKLADELLRTTFAELEATLFEQISGKLRRQLPELIDATLREHFETRSR